MKSNQKPNHWKNCTAMQNTKKGQERYCKSIRGKEKSTNHYKVQCDAQVPKVAVQKEAKNKWHADQDMLCKTTITLSTTILYCYLKIQQS